MPLNTTYSLEPDAAVKGLVADSRRGYNTVTEIAALDLKPGFLVTVKNGKAELPSAAEDYVLGATIWTTTMAQDTAGEIYWKADKAVPVTTEDPIWLEARDTIVEGALVYATISGEPGNVKGAVGATGVTTNPIGRAETDAVLGELVRVKLMPALQGA